MTTEKICVVCGADCAARPRLKDSQGRYACQSCVQSQRRPKKKAPAAAAAVAVARDDAGAADAGFGMDQFLEGVQLADANPCPKCGMGRAADAVVCMQCGFDSASGRAISTKVSKDKPKKVRSAPRMSGGTVFVLIALAMLVLLPVLALVSQEAAVAAWLIATVWAFVAYVMMVVAAFRDDDKFWGIIGVLTIVPVINFFCWLAFALYYCIFGSQRGSWKLNYWASFFAIIIVVAIMATSYPDLLSQAGPEATP